LRRFLLLQSTKTSQLDVLVGPAYVPSVELD
jgi:hypothetical protein